MYNFLDSERCFILTFYNVLKFVLHPFYDGKCYIDKTLGDKYNIFVKTLRLMLKKTRSSRKKQQIFDDKKTRNLFGCSIYLMNTRDLNIFICR